MEKTLLSSRRILRIEAVAKISSGCSSRSSNNPSDWSRSALVSKTPEIGECRTFPRGWRNGLASIWLRKSGDAFSKNQAASSELTATCSCVRARPEKVPRREDRQLGQAQFHCGKPPP